MFMAFLVSFPIIANQIWLFVAPGLYAKEKRLAAPFIVLATVGFVGGAAFNGDGGGLLAVGLAPALCGLLCSDNGLRARDVGLLSERLRVVCLTQARNLRLEAGDARFRLSTSGDIAASLTAI